MHSYLISGGTTSQRHDAITRLKKTFQVKSHDELILVKQEEKQSIGIAEVKAFVSQSILSPRSSPYVVCIIKDAHLLTVEAQNALLKTLEEPPKTVKFILETNNPTLLLPTIISRCECITFPSEEGLTDENNNAVRTLLTECPRGKPGAILSYVDSLVTDKLSAMELVHTILLFLHTDIQTHGTIEGQTNSLAFSEKTYKKALRGAIRARLFLSSHVNFRLVLDQFFLSFT